MKNRRSYGQQERQGQKGQKKAGSHTGARRRAPDEPGRSGYHLNRGGTGVRQPHASDKGPGA